MFGICAGGAAGLLLLKFASWQAALDIAALATGFNALWLAVALAFRLFDAGSVVADVVPPVEFIS